MSMIVNVSYKRLKQLVYDYLFLYVTTIINYYI